MNQKLSLREKTSILPLPCPLVHHLPGESPRGRFVLTLKANNIRDVMRYRRRLRTLRYEDGELGRRRGWMMKTRSSAVVSAKNKILKSKQFSLGTATAIFLSGTNMSTFKDARTLLLESYDDGGENVSLNANSRCFKIQLSYFMSFNLSCWWIFLGFNSKGLKK